MEGRDFLTLLGLVFCVLCSVQCRDSHCQAESGKHCAKVRCEFRHLGTGFAPDLVPDNPVQDSQMKVCYNGAYNPTKKSCCTHHSETMYVEAAKKDFRNNIIAANAYLKSVVKDNLNLHQGQFLAMIEVAEQNTNSLLSEVYNVPWQEMNNALKSLFLDLQQYILHKNVNINLSVSKFFDDLFPIVFNSHSLTEEYKDCLAGIRQHLYPQPFGDMPHKMSLSLMKSLSKARLFLRGLSIILKAVNFTDGLSIDKECSHALTRLQYCSHCEGYTTVKPCKKFCVNVLRGCLAKIEEIGEEWDALVTSLEDLITHMKGPASIFEVTRFLDTKVSGAIMHAMETQHRFYDKVVEKCGHPSQTARNTTNLKDVPYTNNKRVEKKSPVIGDLQATLSSFMATVGESKGLFTRMADMLCNNTLFYDQSPTSTECWNGNDVGSYTKKVPEVRFISQVQHNPEVKVSLNTDSKLNKLKDELAHVKRLLTPQMDEDMMQADTDVTIRSGDRPRDTGYTGFEDDEDFVLSGSGSGDDGKDDGNRKTRKGEGSFKNTKRPNDRPDKPFNAGAVLKSSTILFLSIGLSVFLSCKG